MRIGFNYVDGVGGRWRLRFRRSGTGVDATLSLVDFARRTRLRREASNIWSSSGAFDSFGLRRRELLWQLGLFLPDRRVG